MINTELGDGTFDTIDLKAASTTLGEGDAPYGMDELHLVLVLLLQQQEMEK
jgi:hypothetical protein